MVQWIALKILVKKVYLWVKTYWYVPFAVAYAIVTWFFFRQKAAFMLDNLRETRKAHKKEIDILNKSKEENNVIPLKENSLTKQQNQDQEPPPPEEDKPRGQKGS